MDSNISFSIIFIKMEMFSHHILLMQFWHLFTALFNGSTKAFFSAALGRDLKARGAKRQLGNIGQRLIWCHLFSCWPFTTLTFIDVYSITQLGECCFMYVHAKSSEILQFDNRLLDTGRSI